MQVDVLFFLLISLSLLSRGYFAFLLHQNKNSNVQSYHINNKLFCQPSWLNRDFERVIIKEPEIYTNPIPLFDRVGKDTLTGGHSLASYNLREISESYSLCLSYLGDFCVQIGCASPINPELAVGEFLTSEQVYILLEAVTTLDPLQSNLDYDSTDLEELAFEYKISSDKIFEVCLKNKFNLPFGRDTTLHVSELQRLRNILDSLPEVYDTTLIADQTNINRDAK